MSQDIQKKSERYNGPLGNNIDLDVLDDVWKNPKHHAHDAY